MNVVGPPLIPPSLAAMKPKTVIEKRTRTSLETLMFTPEMISKLKHPPGQRPLRENSKVRALAESIKRDGGVLPGILTLGKIDGIYYVIDGQHRIHAFSLSCLREAFADVRVLHAESMRDIHREFIELNSHLVTMRPDDFLRGMEDSILALQQIRKGCPFVGYDMIRRNAAGCGPILSMSVVLRCWRMSAADTPSGGTAGSAMELAEGMIDEETLPLIDFLALAHEAFGREVEYRPLWSAINLSLTMWLYRRLVITQYSPKSPRLDKSTFKKCLLALSAESAYVEWLVGRHLGERDRSPAYSRIKSLFSRRLEKELGKKVHLPAPAWSVS